MDPPCSAASFEVNSEPHTGARPSVRLCGAYHHFFSFLIFFLGISGKNLVFDIFEVKLCIIIMNLLGNYMNLIRNQDEGITLRASGTRVCLDQDKPILIVPGNQEATRLPGNSGKRKDITKEVPKLSRKLGLPMSAMLRLATRGEKNHHFCCFLIFFLEIPGKNLVFDIFKVKLCVISRDLQRNYLNLIRNQDQEIT
jgi:hypothetical protein